MAVYKTGTAKVDADGIVTGQGTGWKQQLNYVRPSNTIVFNTSPVQAFTISEISSDTEMRVSEKVSSPVPDFTDYFILVTNGITSDALAENVNETLRYFIGRESQYHDLIEFLDTFDWQKLEDMVTTVVDKSDHVDQVAVEVESDRAAAEASKNAAAQSATSSAQSASSSEASNKQSKAQADRAQTIADGIQTTVDSATEAVLQEAARQAEIATEKAGEATSEANRATSEADRAEDLANQLDATNLLRKDKNLSDLNNVSTAKVNLGLDRFTQLVGSTGIQSPDGSQSFSIRNDNQWGVYRTGSGWVPLGVAQGGTGAIDAAGAPFAQKSQNLADLSDKEAARRNLRIDMVEADADADESQLKSPANDAWLFINKKNKNWGVYAVNGDYAGLNIESGGTGAIDAAGARANLEVPGLKTGNFFTGKNSFTGGIYVRPELTSDTSYREICNDTYGRDQSGGVIRSRQFMADGVTLVSAAGMYAWKNTAWGHYPGVLEFNDAINGYGGYSPIDDIVNAGKMSLAPIAYGYCDGDALANGRGAVITRVSAGQYTIRLSGYAHYMPPGRTRRFYLQLTVDMNTEFMIRTQYTSSAGNENGVWRVITTRDAGNSLIINDARWYFTVYCSWY